MWFWFRAQADEAIRTYSEVLRAVPDSARALIGRGSAYALKNQLADAARDFSRASEVEPGNKDTITRLGQVRAPLRCSSLPTNGIAT